MAKNVKLLLNESVEGLGIVGDVVAVRTGYARNFLLPRGLAGEPSEEKIKALAARRAEAQRMLAELRSQREQMIQSLDGVEVTIERACNEQGLLYGSVTQQDVANALGAQGFGIRARDVRLSQTIKRVDHYDVMIRPEADLEALVKVHVVSDRPVQQAEQPEAAAGAAPQGGGGEGEAAASGAPAPAAEGEAEAKPARKRRTK